MVSPRSVLPSLFTSVTAADLRMVSDDTGVIQGGRVPSVQDRRQE